MQHDEKLILSSWFPMTNARRRGCCKPDNMNWKTRSRLQTALCGVSFFLPRSRKFESRTLKKHPFASRLLEIGAATSGAFYVRLPPNDKSIATCVKADWGPAYESPEKSSRTVGCSVTFLESVRRYSMSHINTNKQIRVSKLNKQNLSYFQKKIAKISFGFSCQHLNIE